MAAVKKALIKIEESFNIILNTLVK